MVLNARISTRYSARDKLAGGVQFVVNVTCRCRTHVVRHVEQSNRIPYCPRYRVPGDLWSRVRNRTHWSRNRDWGLHSEVDQWAPIALQVDHVRRLYSHSILTQRQIVRDNETVWRSCRCRINRKERLSPGCQRFQFHTISLGSFHVVPIDCRPWRQHISGRTGTINGTTSNCQVAGAAAVASLL